MSATVPNSALALALILLQCDPPNCHRCRGALRFSGCCSVTAPADAGVREALAHFIRAFDDLDWEQFRLSFDDNATVFYPRAMPQRANGGAEFEKGFKAVFRQIRGSKTTAPYMDIQPKELRIQLLGEVAIATFHS